MDDQQRKNKLYHNWIKGALGLKILKKGIQTVVEDAINKKHADFLQDISRQLGQPNATCNQCVTENMLPCGRNCKHINKVCQTHNQPILMPRPCPNNVCSTLYTNIKDQHTFKSPCWKNTDASLWCKTSWEIAKCYAGDGYADKPTAEEMDCSGILSIIINAQFMQTVMTSPIDPRTKSDIFCKNRENRNAIMHSGTLELTKHQLVGYLDDMISLLNDAKTLQNHPDAMTARTKLNDLKDESYSILTKDELEIREDAMNALEEKKEEALNKIDEKFDDGWNKIDTRYQNIESKLSDQDKELHECLQNAMKEQKQKLELATESGCETIHKRASVLEHNIDNKLKVSMDVIQRTLDKGLDYLQQKHSGIQQSLYQTFEQIQKVVQTCQKDMKSLKGDMQINKAKHEDRIYYLQRKQKLQLSLRSMYKRHKATINISPLLSNITADISDVYTKLVIRDDIINDKRRHDEDQYQGQGQSNQERKRVESLYELFYKNGNCCRKIFVIGDAGMGKTTWSLNLINTWVTALEKKEANLEMLEGDEKVLVGFEFIFYIALRHSNDDEDIKSMIKSQLFKCQNDLNDTTLEILKRESNKCLVILDGLDEFTISVAGIDNTGLPLRDDTYEWTIITTSRMWKMEQVNLPPTEIDRAVVIEGLDKKDVIPLSKTLIEKLNNSTQTRKNADKFIEDTKFYLPNFMTVPLMLTALVCLWHSGGYAGGSMAEVYAGLLVILIKYADGSATNQRPKQSKLDAICYMKKLKTNWSQSEVWLPEILRKHKKVKEYGPLILRLGKLAFYGLFSSDRKTSLVFTEEDIEIYLSTEELEVALNIGILTKTKVVGNVLEKESKLAFLHKTLQEYLASVHTSSQTECRDPKTVDIIIKYFNNASNVFEMENVLLFLSGLHSSTAGLLSEHISNNIAIFEFILGKHIENTLQLKLYILLLKCYNQVEFKCCNTPCEIYIKHHRFNLFEGPFNHDTFDIETAMKYVELHKHLDMSFIIDFDDMPSSWPKKLVQCCSYIQALNSHNVPEKNVRELLKNVRNNLQIKSLTVNNSDYTATTAKNVGEVDLTNNTLLQCLEMICLCADKIILPENDCLVSLILIGVTIRNGLNGLQNHGKLEKLILYDIIGDLEHIDLTKNTALSTLTVKFVSAENTEESVNEYDHEYVVGISKHTSFLKMHRKCLHNLEMSNIKGIDVGHIDLSQNIDLASVTLQNMSIEKITLPKQMCVRSIDLQNVTIQDGVHGLQQQQGMATLLLSNLVGNLGHFDLTQNTSLRKLTLISMSVDNIKFSEQRLIETICFKNIVLTDDLHALICSQHLNTLYLDNVVHKHQQTLEAVERPEGFGHIDLTQSRDLKELTLQNMLVESIKLPDIGYIETIRFSNLTLSNGIRGIHNLQDLKKLTLVSITGHLGHIDLTKHRILETMTLKDISGDRITLPEQSNLFSLKLENILLIEGLHGIQHQQQLQSVEITDIEGQFGHVDLSRNTCLDNLKLKNLSADMITLPEQSCSMFINLENIQLTDGMNGLNFPYETLELRMKSIKGKITHIDLTQTKQNTWLTLQNMSVDKITLPENGCSSFINLSNLSLTAGLYGMQHQKDMNRLKICQITGTIGDRITLPEQSRIRSLKVENIKLKIGPHGIQHQQQIQRVGITGKDGPFGHIDLSRYTCLEVLSLKNMSVDMLTLPEQSRIRSLKVENIKLKDGPHGIKHQQQIQRVGITDIEGPFGHIDLSRNTYLKVLSLKNLSVDMLTLPEQSCIESMKLENISLTDGLNNLNLQHRLDSLMMTSIKDRFGHKDLTKNHKKFLL